MDVPNDAFRLVPSARQCGECNSILADAERFGEHWQDHHADGSDEPEPEPEPEPDGED